MSMNLPFDSEPDERTTAAPNAGEYTVTEIAFALKRTLEETFGYVRVRGEISGFRGAHASGHCYFTLKDSGACIDAVVWRTAFVRLRGKIQEGLEVVASGRVSANPRSSKHQLIVESIEPAGVGALMALIEDRKRRLAAEGLFEQARKKPIPYLPGVIGVVTSPTGAVIRDILHRLADRFPRRVVVWPVRVQGETSAAEVAGAIGGFNALAPGGRIPRPDLIIVARGGGSLEDLWGFNDEAVVRAAAASAIPLISAVGHETDWTLIDFAADERCPTPTAAAERAVPVRSELATTIAAFGARAMRAEARILSERRARIVAAARGLPRTDDVLATARQRLDSASARLAHGLKANLDIHRAAYLRVSGRLSIRPYRQKLTNDSATVARLAQQSYRAFTRLIESRWRALESVEKLRHALSYQAVLERGFTLVLDQSNRPIRSATATSVGQSVTLRFQDSDVAAMVGGSRRPRRTSSSSTPSTQGSLF